MSHYSTLVITRKGGPGVDELLDPYGEGMRVAPYLVKTKEEIMEDIDYKRNSILRRLEEEKLKDPDAYAKKYPDESDLPNIVRMTDEEAYQDYIEGELVDEDGGILSTYNPDAKWDWYNIGGRWDNLLILKNGTRVNNCLFKDLDIKALNSYSKQSLKYWDRFWEVKVEGSPIKDEERDTDFFTFRTEEYYLTKYRTKEEFLEKIQRFSTYAVVTKDGIWHEQGLTGRFEEEEDWDENFTKRFLTNLDPDDIITVIDCHI